MIHPKNLHRSTTQNHTFLSDAFICLYFKQINRFSIAIEVEDDTVGVAAVAHLKHLPHHINQANAFDTFSFDMQRAFRRIRIDLHLMAFLFLDAEIPCVDVETACHLATVSHREVGGQRGKTWRSHMNDAVVIGAFNDFPIGVGQGPNDVAHHACRVDFIAIHAVDQIGGHTTTPVVSIS